MKKSLITLLSSVILLSSLLFSPIQSFSGEDVTNNHDYLPLKESRIKSGAKKDFTMEREGSLLIEKHTLEKGEDPMQYAKKIKMSWCGAFKGNKLEIISMVIYRIGYNPAHVDMQKKEIIDDLRDYLSKP